LLHDTVPIKNNFLCRTGCEVDYVWWLYSEIKQKIWDNMATTGNFPFYELLCFERRDVSLCIIKHLIIKLCREVNVWCQALWNFSTTWNE